MMKSAFVLLALLAYAGSSSAFSARDRADEEVAPRLKDRRLAAEIDERVEHLWQAYNFPFRPNWFSTKLYQPWWGDYRTSERSEIRRALEVIFADALARQQLQRSGSVVRPIAVSAGTDFDVDRAKELLRQADEYEEFRRKYPRLACRGVCGEK